MESQGNGNRVGRTGNIESCKPPRGPGYRPWGRPWLIYVLLCMVLFASEAIWAQSSTYTYDANGRVVAVTKDGGASAQYSYDSVGNLVQISSTPAGQLAIFAFMPTHGTTGTQVLIEGQGFSSTPAGNSVSFAGVLATVLSASSNQLTTTVPSGATTGPISITVGGQTATSAVPFVVDNTGLPPTISQVSPSFVAVGGTVAVAGAHLDPVAGATVLQMAGREIQLATASDSQLQYTVPPNAATGYVNVQTPYGHAVSAAPVVVLPAGIAQSAVVSSGYATTNGAAVSLSMNAGGQVGSMLFDGSAGDWLSLQATNITTTASSIAYTIYAPGNKVIQQGTISASSPSIHLPQLVASGIYLATFQPSAAGAQITLGVESNTRLALDTPLAAHMAASWQSKRMLFTATPGQNLEFTISSVNVTGGSGNMLGVHIYNSAGTQIASYSCFNYNPGASCTQHLWSLAADTYSIVAVPNDGGIMTFNEVLRADTSAGAMALDTSMDLAFSAGQVQRFTFVAQAGQTVALQATGTTTPSSSSAGVTYQIYRPDAGVITTGTAIYASFDSNSASPVANLQNLPVSGTYTVIASPDYGLAATAHIRLASGINGAVPINGTSSNFASSVPSQNIYLSFAATQGENLELTLSHVSTPGSSSNSVNVYIYNSSGAQVDYYTCYGSSPGGNCIRHLWSMPVGVYSVVVVPPAGGTASFGAQLQDDIVGPALATNGNAALSLGAGQAERLTFNANAGDTLALNISGITTTAGQGITLAVYRPDAGLFSRATATYASFDSSNTPTINLANLPISGTYTIVVAPDYGLPLTAQVKLLAGAVGTLQTGGSPQSLTTYVPFQNIYFSFTAQQSDDLELTLNNIVTSGTSYPLLVQVIGAGGQLISSFNCSMSSTVNSCSQHLWHMAQGAYQVVVTPYYAYSGTMSFNAVLLPDIVGPVLVPNTPLNLNLSAGQVERLAFNASAGDTVALQFANVATTPSLNQQAVKFLIYRPDAGQISTGTATYTSIDVVGTQTVNLSNLPISGTYRVIVAPDNGFPATAQVQLVTGVTGSVPTTGSPQNYVTSASGQNAYLTFSAAQGANLELSLSNLSMQGPGTKSIVGNVYNSSTGVQVASFTCSASNPNGSCIQPLWYLPAGNYSVILSPYSGNNGGTMTFNASLQPDAEGDYLALTQVRNVVFAAGQAERLTFNADPGDTVTLQVSNVLTTPTGNSINFAVYRPDVGAIMLSTPVYNSFSVSSGTQSITLPNLPVGGVYTVIATPQYGLAASATIWKMSDTPGAPPTYGTPTITAGGAPQALTASGAGQSVTMSFNANWGDNLELTLSGITVPGASTNGFRVDIYSPAGTAIQGYYCYASNPGTSCRVALWNLSAGTYKVVVSAAWGGTTSFNAQLLADVLGPTLTPNAPIQVGLASGQVERLTFSANAGDTVALGLSSAATTPSGQPVYIAVYRPDAGPVSTAYQTTSATSSTTLNLPNLPVTGTYTVAVYTAYGQPGSATVALETNISGVLTKDASTQHFTASSTGQNVYASFNASLGDNLELTLAGLSTTTGSSLSALLQVYGPAGNQVFSGYCSSGNPGGDCRVPLFNLAAGRYSVIIVPQSNVAMSFDAMLLSDIQGPALTLNTPAHVILGAGQVQRLTFNANIGDTVALNLSSASTTPGGQYVYVSVCDPEWGAIGTSYYATTYTAGSTTLNLPSLPATGTYTVLVYTSYGQPGQVNLNLVSGVTGSVPTGASSPTFANTVSGQNAYLSFGANAGDNLELTLNNVVGSFSGNIYSPSGTQVGTINCYGGSPGASCTTSLWNLAAGTYSVILNGGLFSFTAQLQLDQAGPALTAGVPVSASLGAGQAKRFTFYGTQGDNVALALSGVTTIPAGQSIYASIYRPDGGAITLANFYAQVTASGSQTANLSSLPVTGIYTVVLEQASYGLPASAQIVLETGLSSTLTKNGDSQSFAASAWNERYYTSFDAVAGDNLELAFSNVSVPNNSFTSGISINVYDPFGRAVNAYGTCGESSDCLFSLSNLISGTYHVVVSPGWNGTMSFNVKLTSDVVGQVLAPGVTVPVNLAQGQVERLYFNGNQGQDVSLNLSGLATSPSGQSVYLSVYRPDGGAINVNSNGSSLLNNYYANLLNATGGTLNLPSLPVTGTYIVTAYSYNGVPFTGQITLGTAQNAPLATDATAQSFTLDGPSHDEYLNFAANAGDNLELTLSNLYVLVGGGGTLRVTVYGPDGATVAAYNCYTSDAAAGCSHHLWNLQSGNYSISIGNPQAGTIKFDARLQPDVTGDLLTLGAPVQVGPSTAPVQRLTFNANAGDNLALDLSNVNTSPAGQGISIAVYRPDVGSITTGNAYVQAESTGSNTLSLSSLPVSGTYTVVFSTHAGVPVGARLTLRSQ